MEHICPCHGRRFNNANSLRCHARRMRQTAPLSGAERFRRHHCSRDYAHCSNKFALHCLNKAECYQQHLKLINTPLKPLHSTVQ